MDGRLSILTGDCRDILPTLEARSVQCCVTSPPYWGLRDYGTAQWEGGEAGCDHVESLARRDLLPEYLDRRAKEFNSGTGNGSKVTPIQFRALCGKCGARRIDSQLGLEATPDCGKQGFMRLRPDLTDEQREYVVRRLLGVFDRDAARNGKDNKA